MSGQAHTFLTVGQIKEAAIAEAIGSTTSALTSLQDTQLIEFIETVNSWFVNAAHELHAKGGWSWMLKRKPFQTKAKTTLNGAASAGAATFILTSAADFDASGKVVIETAKGALDFVDYESKASNTLTVSTATGADVLDIDHATSEKVEKLYALPSDYAKTKALYLNSTEVFYTQADLFPNPGHYTTVGPYLLFHRGVGAQDGNHLYYKKPSTLTQTTDATDIPTGFQRYPIEMCLYHVFRIRRKRADAPDSLELAQSALDEALAYDKSPTAASATTGLDTDY